MTKRLEVKNVPGGIDPFTVKYFFLSNFKPPLTEKLEPPPDAVDSGQMLNQHQFNVFSCVSWVLLCMPLGQMDVANTHNTGQLHGASIVSMLAVYNAGPTFGQRCHITINARCTSQPTFKQQWIIVSCFQGWCSLQVMCLIQICTHRGRSI